MGLISSFTNLSDETLSLQFRLRPDSDSESQLSQSQRPDEEPEMSGAGSVSSELKGAIRTITAITVAFLHRVGGNRKRQYY